MIKEIERVALRESVRVAALTVYLERYGPGSASWLGRVGEDEAMMASDKQLAERVMRNAAFSKKTHGPGQ